MMNNVQVPQEEGNTGRSTRPSADGTSGNQSRFQLHHQSSLASSVSRNSGDGHSRISQQSSDPSTSRTSSPGNNSSSSNRRMELANYGPHNTMYSHVHTQHQPQHRQERVGNYAMPPHAAVNQQQQQQQQQAPSSRPQMSATFYSRSSPIAIIHNPEDGVDQAKLRWQHPMYDTSDDEMNDDDLFLHHAGFSVESLTAPAEPPRSGAPQSLPTALLRAPKLGSLPAQDYRLLHLATLPPPMSLDTTKTDTLHTVTVSGPPSRHTSSQSYGGNPKYLSSYGSLRESHLTGRFIGPVETPRTHFEPPPTLIPPRNPPPPTTILQPHNPSSTTAKSPILLQVTHSPIANSNPKPKLSIRDRMIQKAQQKESEQLQQYEPGDTYTTTTSKASSTLSTMLEASEQDYKANGQKVIRAATENGQPPQQNPFFEHSTGALHRSSLGPGVLPPAIARAVAISYNSNLHLFASNSQNSPQHPPQEEYRASSSAMLSSSMTGLEILRAASKSKHPARPTSLRILQDSSPGSLQGMPPPPVNSTGSEQHFLPLARTMSEPSPHCDNPALHQSSTSQPTTATAAPPLHTALLQTYAPCTGLVQAQATTHRHTFHPQGLVQTSNGRILIPPRKTNTTTNHRHVGTAGQVPLLQDARSHELPVVETTSSNLHHTVNAWGVSVANDTTKAAAAAALPPPPPHTGTFASQPYHGSNNNPPYGTHTGDEEPNPDTQGAFDMDLE